MPGMGHPKFIIEAPEQNGIFINHPMPEHPKQLFRQQLLLHPIMIVQRRLCAPANVQCAVNMGFRPLHNPAKLLPVFHLLKGQLFHRRAGDDEAVKISILDFLKAMIEGNHMLLGSVFRLVGGHLDEKKLHLQRGIAQQPGELCLGGDFGGHQV